MTYEQFLAALSERRRFGMRPGLDELARALAVLGDPRPPRAVIHIAGSNGKGSTAAMCEAIARAAGRSTLLFTSPHLARFTERIRVDGEELAREEVATLGARALRASGELTYFEVATAIAFMAAAAHDVDVAIFEVGLGGRLDATNLLQPDVTVVTSISLEHVEILGPTLTDIAREKAGIAKPGVPLFIGPIAEEARREIARVVAQTGATLEDATAMRAWVPEMLALGGAHQRENAALALAAMDRLGFDRAPAARALSTVRWPARLEEISPGLWIDAAHNPEGARALADAILRLARGRGVALVFGVVDDKDARAMLAALAPVVQHVVLTRPASPRARDPRALTGEISGARVVEEPLAALAIARTLAPVVVVAGSIFLVGALRAALSGEATDPIRDQEKLER